MSHKLYKTMASTALLVFAMSAAHAQDSVLVVNANSNNNTQLNAALTGTFSTVDNFNLGSGTPTLGELQAYDAVIAYTNFPPSDASGTGDVLADYVDGGGCLVLSTYAFSQPWAITGRIATTGYSPLTDMGLNGNVSGNLNPIIPNDPVFNGVDLGSLTYFHNSNFARPGVDAGATLVADDGNGVNMIARNASMNVVGINMYPGDISGNSDDQYTIYANAASSCTGGSIDSTTATFQVTKIFTDGNTDEVDVTLTCNGGLPLVQDFTISGGGPGVTFSVSDIPDTGVTCSVTESNSPDNYTTVLTGGDGGDDCTWAGVTSGYHSCAISNEPIDGTFTVNMDWVTDEEADDDFDTTTPVTIWCDAEITPGTEDGTSGDWYYETSLSDGESMVVTVDNSAGDVSCWAEQTIDLYGVQTSHDCDAQDVSSGDEASCTFVNTFFFEGIPTLSQYGLAILVLLTLGMGMVGYRRIV